MEEKMKKLTCLLLITLLLFSMVGCSPKDTPPNIEGLEKITVVLDWTPNTNHTGLYVAQKMGYFAEMGLDVEIVQPPEDGATMLVASGKAQFGIDFQDSIAPAFLGDHPLPVTAVAALVQHNTSGIISLKDKDISSPKGLEEKTYATWDLPVEKAMIEHVMKKDSGDFSKLNLVPSTVLDVVTALQTNVDAVWVFYGWDGIATKVKGLETNYFAFKDIDPVFDYYTPILIGNNDFLANNPETTKKFLSAVKQGYEYSISEPKKAADILLEVAPELDKELIYQSQQYLAGQYKSEVEQWGYMDPQRWDGFYGWLFENKLIDTAIPAGFGFTNDFLE